MNKRERTTYRPRSQDGEAPRLYITVRLPPGLMERVDAECATRMVSRTYIVEKAMEEWLYKNEGKAS